MFGRWGGSGEPVDSIYSPKNKNLYLLLSYDDGKVFTMTMMMMIVVAVDHHHHRRRHDDDHQCLLKMTSHLNSDIVQTSKR